MATVTSATHAVSEFTSHEWIRAVDVPAAVVVTTLDRIVPAPRQLKLARAIPNALVHEINADHGVCVNSAANFGNCSRSVRWSPRGSHPAPARPTNLRDKQDRRNPPRG